MRIKSFILLPLFFVSTGLAADYSRWMDNDLPKLVYKIKDLQHQDSGKINFIKETWAKKCGGKKPFTCYLTEKDVLPEQGREGRILFFRGEDGKYELSGVSSLVRSSLSGNNICGISCSPNSLAKNMYNIVSRLTITSEQDLYYRVHAYNESVGHWYASEKPVAGNYSFSPFEVLSSKHIKAEAMYLTTSEGKKTSFDPFVSLSVSPVIGAGFMDGKKGRLLIVSVPENKARQFYRGSDECKQNLSDMRLVVRLQQCGPSDKFEGEQEFTALFHIPSDYLFDVVSWE